ncbi:MAG: sugar phosphate isomerase/epimerase family protein [Candidatus Velamenicoccus archaeovorus]
MTAASFPRPQLICSTAAFFSRPLREAFAHIAGAGFSGVEVMVTRDPDTQEPHRLRDLSEEHELAIRAIHAPFLVMTRTVWGTDPVRKIYRAIELAEDLDVPLVVVHPPYRWQTGYRRWLDGRLPGLSEHTGVRVAVENMFPVRLPGSRGVSFHTRHQPAELERFSDVVLDTSHAAVSGLDPSDTFRRLGNRVSHVHLSNNAGKGWDSHLPVEQGVLPLAEFLDAVASDGFRGAVSLELDLRRYLDAPAELRRVLVANREFCQARLPLAA